MRLGQNMSRLCKFKRVFVLVLVLGTFTLSGCEKRERGEKDSEVALDVVSSPEGLGGEDAERVLLEAGQDQSAERLLEVEAWPGQREMLTFSLTWLGGEEEVVLRAGPDLASAEVARRGWEDGSEVEWSDTRVVVLAGRPFRALKDARLKVISFDPGAEVVEPEEMVEEEFALEVKAGELIDVYQYVGEGACYLGAGEQMYVGDCPGKEFVADVEVEEGERKLEPLEQEWWVLVGDGAERGWVRADDSLFEARTRRMAEYE